MEKQNDTLQQRFFSLVKERLPQHISLPDMLCELLDIKYDSAYRRIRGEKPLTLQELQRLSTHFNISIDALFNLETDAVVFHTNASSRKDGIENYFVSMTRELELIRHAHNKKITYCAKDIPVLHYFNFPELAWFKLFFWGKTTFKHSGTDKQKFSLQQLNHTIIDQGKKALSVYNLIPSAEIWSLETVNSTIRQIAFYEESGFFENASDAKIILEQLAELAEHIKNQSEAGQKFLYGAAPKNNYRNFELYVNDIILGYTTILIEADTYKKTFFLHDVLDYLTTTDHNFCENTSDILSNIIKKSSLISVVNEKERNKFFRQIQSKINSNTAKA